MGNGYFGELYLRFWRKKLDEVADREVKEILSLYEVYGSGKPRCVFDLGAGWGRHMLRFPESVDVWGIEREKVFVETYRKEAPDGLKDHLFQGDIANFSVPENLWGKCQLVISLFSSLGWDEETDRKAFHVASTLLEKGGIFIVDADNRDAYAIHPPSRTWQKVDGGIVLDKHRINWTDSTLITKREIHTERGEVITLKRQMRLYSLHEIVNIGKYVGLSFEGAFSNLHMGAWSIRSGRNVVVLRKEG